MNEYKSIRNTAFVLLLTGFFMLCVSAPAIADDTSITEEIEQVIKDFVGDDVGGDENNGEGVLFIDRMDNQAQSINELGGRNAVYTKPPSSAFYSKGPDYGKGENNSGLKIDYRKSNTGGPFGGGGWCGFYTLLHRNMEPYLDGSQYNYLTFWVKGEEGGENFKVGVADVVYEQMDDSLKTPYPVSHYLPKKQDGSEGAITTEWQLAVIPTDDIFLDWEQLHAMAICFETDVFPDGGGSGVVYIDDLALRVENPREASNSTGAE